MNRISPTFVKLSVQCLALLVMLVFAHGLARADEVTIAGTTGGCFGLGCTPGSTGQSNTATLLGLTYNGSMFNGTTSNGFLGIGNMPTPPTNLDNLGSFTLSGAPNLYNGQLFTLRVTFTLPTGITGGNPASFNASLTGSVTSTDVGGVFVDFNNTPILFTFSNPNGTGSFTFMVNDPSVIAGGIIAVSGVVTGAQQTTVPEPASLLLLGTGMVGLGAGLRRRYRKRNS